MDYIERLFKCFQCWPIEWEYIYINISYCKKGMLIKNVIHNILMSQWEIKSYFQSIFFGGFNLSYTMESIKQIISIRIGYLIQHVHASGTSAKHRSTFILNKEIFPFIWGSHKIVFNSFVIYFFYFSLIYIFPMGFFQSDQNMISFLK